MNNTEEDRVWLNISRGNKKTGAIPSFSLPSGLSCSARARTTCFQQGCYANKIERLRPNVKAAYSHNLKMVTANIEKAEQWLNWYFDNPNAPRLFRLHVSGDFFSTEYFDMWIRVICKHPQTQFLAFTKQYEIIKPHLSNKPSNLSLVWSGWPGVPIPTEIANILPIAWVQDGTETRAPKDAYICPGSCETCAKCWNLDLKGVVFDKH